jgi:cytokinesis protein
MPEIAGLTSPNDDMDILSPASENTSERPDTSDGTTLSVRAEDKGAISEGEDVADRAATLLQGLRGSTGDNDELPLSRDSENLRVRRRRDHADTERDRRRRRRAPGTSTASTDGRPQTALSDGSVEHHDDDVPSDVGHSDMGELANLDMQLMSPSMTPESPPITIVSPPSPTNTVKKREFSAPLPESPGSP